MNPEQTQQLNPNEARTSLGIATRLSDQLMKAQNPVEAPVGAGTASSGIQPQEAPKEAFDPEAFKQEVDKSVKETIREEMSKFKEDLAKSLEDNNDDE